MLQRTSYCHTGLSFVNTTRRETENKIRKLGTLHPAARNNSLSIHLTPFQTCNLLPPTRSSSAIKILGPCTLCTRSEKHLGDIQRRFFRPGMRREGRSCAAPRLTTNAKEMGSSEKTCQTARWVDFRFIGPRRGRYVCVSFQR